MKKQRNRPDKPRVTHFEAPSEAYRVGPGRPPKEHQFKPGQSGNPKGAKRKKPAMSLNLKAVFERSLCSEVKLIQGQSEEFITKGAAGIEQLVTQFAKGDRYARRDVIELAGILGVDLIVGHREVIEKTVNAVLVATDNAIIEDYIRRYLAERKHANDSAIDASESNDQQDANTPSSTGAQNDDLSDR